MTRTAIIFLAGLLAAASSAAPRNVSFSDSSETLDKYDYFEATARADAPDAKNPFIDPTLSGTFAMADGTASNAIEGFCDAAGGSLFRIRFMPSHAGDYSYSVAYRQGEFQATHSGKFKVASGQRRGPIRVDRDYP